MSLRNWIKIKNLKINLLCLNLHPSAIYLIKEHYYQNQNLNKNINNLYRYKDDFIDNDDLYRDDDNLMPGPLDYNRGLKTTRLVPGGSLYRCQHTMMHVDEVNHLFSHLDLSGSGCSVETCAGVNSVSNVMSFRQIRSVFCCEFLCNKPSFS